jgi:hypothetical protein
MFCSNGYTLGDSGYHVRMKSWRSLDDFPGIGMVRESVDVAHAHIYTYNSDYKNNHLSHHNIQ